ncbi:hypothetical protein [Streptosporangium minutum]|nr:hypothetical protein [Streptosporangium minutum]
MIAQSPIVHVVGGRGVRQAQRVLLFETGGRLVADRHEQAGGHRGSLTGQSPQLPLPR